VRKAFIRAGLIAVLLATAAQFASAQAPAALLGVWEGTASNARGSVPSRIVFVQKGDQVTWKWSWTMLTPPASAEAEGSVSSLAGAVAELKGAYTAHTSSAMQGSVVTLRLNLGDDQLSGAGISARGNQPFNVAFTKKK
jgi:hypothetical protein